MRGFAMVERWDTESYEDFVHGGLFSLDLFDTVEDNLHQPPVLTRTWFHTGALIGHQGFSARLAEEYWDGDTNAADWRLPDTVLPDGLTGREAAEAARALRGRMLRQEVYAIDGSADEDNPYTLLEQNFAVRREQARLGATSTACSSCTSAKRSRCTTSARPAPVRCRGSDMRWCWRSMSTAM